MHLFNGLRQFSTMEETSYCLNKKVKKKKKGYFRFIQRNIEFYLSDANLRRDRVLRKELNKNLEIDASFFLKCKRIQELGATFEDVRTALKPSRILELVSDSKIRRKVAIIEKSKEEVDRCSIYVERLSSDITPEALSRIFSAFGKVSLVSIPKYTSNKKVKGYGFVEFERESACTAALQKFASFGGLLCGDQDYPSCKKCLGQIAENDTEIEPPTAVVEPVTVAAAAAAVKNASLVEESEIITSTGKAKRNRKKKKWQRKKKCYANLGFRIMAKVAWNQLRQRYLSLQATNRRSMKLQLAKLKRPSTRPPRIKALVPGTVVTLTSTRAFTEIEAKGVKKFLRQVKGVEYVDVEAGQHNGYVRLSTPDAASWVIRHGADLLPSYRVELLPPSAEDLYWIKIEHDRQKRLKSDKPKKNVGGGKKILMRAEKHLGAKIRFSPNGTVTL